MKRQRIKIRQLESESESLLKRITLKETHSVSPETKREDVPESREVH